MQDYCDLLVSFPEYHIHTVAHEYFVLALEAMAEAWRRFQFVVTTYPFAIFQWVDMDDKCLWKECVELEKFGSRCPACIDSGFTRPIIDFIQATDVDEAALRVRTSAVRALLKTVMIHCPISSDVVECLHGYCQQLLRTGSRGTRPSDNGAMERILWGLVSKSYEKLRGFIADYFADKQAAHRCHRYGAKGSNQYTKALQKQHDEGSPWPPRALHGRKPALNMDKMDRAFASSCLVDVGSQKIRKLCGWNIFQREWMAGQQLEPAQWKLKQHECSQKWKTMSEAEKDRFVAAAAEEEGRRSDAALEAWPSKRAPSTDEGVQLPRGAMKLVSRQKTIVTYRNFKESPWWDELGYGLSTADGVLRLDDIDLKQTDREMSEKFAGFVKPVNELPEQMHFEDDPSVHHTACQFGECQSHTSALFASRFVNSMADQLTTGALPASLGSFLSFVSIHR